MVSLEQAIPNIDTCLEVIVDEIINLDQVWQGKQSRSYYCPLPK